MAEQKVELAQEEDREMAVRKQMLVLVQENEQLRQEIASLQEQNQGLIQDRDAAYKFAEAFKRAADEAEKSLAIAQSSIAELTLKAKKDAVDSGLLADARAQIDRLTAERDDFQQKTQTAATYLQGLKAERDALKSDLNQSRDDLARVAAEKNDFQQKTQTAAGFLQGLKAKNDALQSDLNQSRVDLDQVRRLNVSLTDELERSRLHNDSSDSVNDAEESPGGAVTVQPGLQISPGLRRKSNLVIDQLRQMQGNRVTEEDGEVVRRASPRDEASRQAMAEGNNSFFGGVARFAKQNSVLTATAAASIGVAAIVIKSIL